ncbi:MAG: hypothetical protein KatS3mg009_2445 [Acidimicrobiia bacterium]|nr:MAG: hypothetical protein KatS3mg009_2445 [Acidimicrobiia bacterium]
MGAMRRLRVLVALAVAGLAPALTAAPAHAHGLGGEEPTNVRTRLVAVEPPAAGVEVDLVGLGRSVELRVARGHEVVVLGYEGEPYLWVTPDGVLRNARSPATYQNRTLSAPAGVPARYDASAPPEWERIADGTTVRWHDHRAHYMGTGAFAGVRTFTIPMRVDGRDVSVRGEMRWVEPPPWWPWPLLAAALALAVVLVARASYRVGAVLALTALVAGEAVHVAGSWQAAGASLAGARGLAGAVGRRGRPRRVRARPRAPRGGRDGGAVGPRRGRRARRHGRPGRRRGVVPLAAPVRPRARPRARAGRGGVRCGRRADRRERAAGRAARGRRRRRARPGGRRARRRRERSPSRHPAVADGGRTPVAAGLGSPGGLPGPGRPSRTRHPPPDPEVPVKQLLALVLAELAFLAVQWLVRAVLAPRAATA